jgi:2-polyprenyl-3-methyl-5-hydroxy-6-metoxy-1,4-benzoquinol methylase
MTAKDHYDNHLARFYSWMVGSFSEKQQTQQDFFIRNGITPNGNEVAIDIGAGNGLQSISLAKLGFEVIAVDFNRQLLDELISHKADLHIKTVCDDASNFLESFDGHADVIVCMGDTVTHLETIDHVERLLANISQHLALGGRMVISFRELIAELKGSERFIPVRSDETRILTCFLEYFPNHVMVHDIVHELQTGTWIQKVSCYPKLRFSEAYMKEALERYKLRLLSTQRISGMIYMIAQKLN